MKNFVLQAAELPGEHNHQRIGEDINNSISNWALEDHVEGLTTDNGSNVKEADIDVLKAAVGPLHWPHITALCYATPQSRHTRTVSQCKTLVKHFKMPK